MYEVTRFRRGDVIRCAHFNFGLAREGGEIEMWDRPSYPSLNETANANDPARARKEYVITDVFETGGYFGRETAEYHNRMTARALNANHQDDRLGEVILFTTAIGCSSGIFREDEIERIGHWVETFGPAIAN